MSPNFFTVILNPSNAQLREYPYMLGSIYVIDCHESYIIALRTI